MNDPKLVDLQLISYYVNEGLSKAAQLREDSIVSFGQKYINNMTVAQVGVHFLNHIGRPYRVVLFTVCVCGDACCRLHCVS